MNYVRFLKEMNNIENGNWKALVSRERDFVLIKTDCGPAIHVNRDDNGEIRCSLYSLPGVEKESLDLVIDFVKSTNQLEVGEVTADIAEKFGMIKQFDNAGAVMISMIKEALTEHANED